MEKEVIVDATNAVAGYYRISQSRDGMSAPEIYEAEITRYCEYQSLNLEYIFSDIDYSGYKRSENRPALQELVSRRREFGAVVVPKLSRFGRSLKHLTELFDLFDRDGIALIFLDLKMDTSTSQGRLLRNIMSAFAEYESDVKSDYQSANLRHATLQGLPGGGPPPYGYRRANKSYAIHPSQGGVVRFIFELYDGGMSQSEIARELTARGIPTAKGHERWVANKVGRLLDNPSYVALMPLDGKLVEGKWPPLVNPGTWNRVAVQRKATREKWSRPRAPKRLLAGLIYCGDCQRKAYYTARGRGGPGRYKCATGALMDCRAGGINAPKVERFVEEAFLQRAETMLMKGAAGEFVASRQWELSNDQERRMLLSAAIERVVILPRDPTQEHPGRKGRSIRIVWREKLTHVHPPPTNQHTVGTGRALVLARDQLSSAKEAREMRSARSRGYFEEWRAFQEKSRPDHD